MDDLLVDFLTESSENLLRIEQEMVELEQRPDDADLLGSIFRSMHTIKGTCGFLGLGRLEGVTHSAENVLGALREGKLQVSDDLVSDILGAVDVVKEILSGLEEDGEEPTGDDSALVARLERWMEDDGDEEKPNLDDLFATAKAAALDAGSDAAPDADDATPEEVDAAIAAADAAVAAKKRAAASKESSSTAQKTAPESGRSLKDATLRVNVDVLDRLMNLAGELVLTRNQLNQLAQSEDHSAFASPIQQLNRVSTDLQEAVMKTRMQPVGNAWGKLPRLVRDLCNASGKKIDLVMLGAETELDRQILQAITDPLTHMIRNSGDHGIEYPEERTAAGKDERGRIELEAFHEGGHIVIEIRDDGKGLDVEAIRRKAVDRGLLDAEEADSVPNHRVYEYIFEAGFSTATQVTAVSGRGVGMDVVRRNIEAISGSIEVESELGQGTTFRIKIPLTLAIMSALIVGVRGQSFAVPQIGVLELVGVGQNNVHKVENVSGALFFRLRDQLLPLVRLDAVLGLEEDAEDVANILVCQVGASRFGLIVDSILDTHEIVVKPVGRMVKGVHAYSGTTILGDGRVIMILDIPGIAQHSDVLSRTRREVEADMALDARRRTAENGTSLLIFDAGESAPRAVPLSQVARLEEFSAEDIEWADGRWLVQYRGELLPLIAASPAVEMRALDPRPVIVFTDGVHSMGLAVDGIRDIVREDAEVRAESRSEGLIGSIVVDGRTTELVDIDYYLTRSRWIGASASPPEGTGYVVSKGPGSDQPGNGAVHRLDGHRVLLVDDSPFFLNMLGPALRSHGFDVAVSHDGRHALSRIERGEEFDVVVSDIDMPHMDGFELARRVRETGSTDLPMIALTSRGSDRDRKAGMEAGFDQYLTKFDQGEVISAVRAVFGAVDASLVPEEVFS